MSARRKLILLAAFAFGVALMLLSINLRAGDAVLVPLLAGLGAMLVLGMTFVLTAVWSSKGNLG